MTEATDSRSAMFPPYFHLQLMKECPKITVVEAAGKSPNPASSSSWAYRHNCTSSLHCNWVTVQLGLGQSNMSGNDLPHYPCLLPLQLVRWKWLLEQLWELPNENAEP